MKAKKASLALFSGLIFLGSLLLFYAFTPRHYSVVSHEPQPRWKNLQVLPQDISKDSLMSLMHGYERALSVQCSHCHASKEDGSGRLDFASDAKIEKEIARGMIKMTNEINEKYFKPHFPDPKPKQVHVINCVVCHRGTVNPELYLSNMSEMYKTFKEGRDNRKEMILKQRSKEKQQ